MSPSTQGSSAVPPSPQEIHRKLSLHTAPKGKKLAPVSTTPIPAGNSSDSDSDSLMTPDVGTPSPGLGGSFSIGNTAQQPLTAIAERHSVSGEDSEEEDEEGGWKAADAQGGHKASLEDLVLKAGYLWKKGERRKTWKKRWFVLRPSHLAYYKTAAEYQLLRLLELSDVHSCTPVALKKHDNAFGLVSPVRTFYLQAKTPEEVQQWVKAIEEARQNLNAPSTQGGGSSPIPIPSSHPPPVRSMAAITPSPPSQAAPSYTVTSSDSEDTASVQRSYSASSQTKPTVTSPAKTTGAPMDASKAILSGYLMKCGSKRQKWRKRWFVLTGEKLVYSASHMDTKPHRYFTIGEILDALEYDLPANRLNPSLASPINPPSSATSPPQETLVDNQQPFTFKIVTTRRTLLLCAPSEEDEIRWLGAVRALIARRSGAGGVPGDVTTKSTSPAGGGTESGVTSPTGGLRGKIRRLSVSGSTGGNNVSEEK